jgi:hypothetical protein
MKPTHTPNFWISYVSAIKESVQRELTQQEVSLMMQMYINRKSVEECVKELEGLK